MANQKPYDPFANLKPFDGGDTIKPAFTPLTPRGEDSPSGRPTPASGDGFGDQLPNAGTATTERPR